jgi:hypothetical protein
MHKYGFDLVFIVYGTLEKTNAPKKCVTIAGKEYINDERPKQNIIKCL